MVEKIKIMQQTIFTDKTIKKQWRVIAIVSYVLCWSAIFDGNGWIWEKDIVRISIYSMQIIAGICLIFFLFLYKKNKKMLSY